MSTTINQDLPVGKILSKPYDLHDCCNQVTLCYRILKIVLPAIFVFLKCNLELQFDATEIHDDLCLSISFFGSTSPNSKSFTPVLRVRSMKCWTGKDWSTGKLAMKGFVTLGPEETLHFSVNR